MYKSLFIVSDVRCGSTYAAELLAYNVHVQRSVDFWELLKEPFQALTADTTGKELARLFAQLWANPMAWRAGMVKCSHLSIINKLCGESDELRDQFFGADAYWVRIRRDDVFARSVSLAHALASGRYHEYGELPVDRNDYTVTNEQIHDCLGRIALADYFLAGCSTRFQNLIEYRYEDILSDERGFINGVGRFAFGEPVLSADDELVRPKLQPVNSERKGRQRQEFIDWFIRNYH